MTDPARYSFWYRFKCLMGYHDMAFTVTHVLFPTGISIEEEYRCRYCVYHEIIPKIPIRKNNTSNRL